ncbi:NADH dehydrogenase [ubiquinone] 1 alpha subcomplex assembly factor 2 [Amphibalanus amphitrite]|uniref:NADH dehydrogenase [ubiquinone] 1 alpha subcomplex assembly factor 2 n=2 Tax=Amphibalanus amphitrite TaxID=1232801 RepID=A0A6A4W0K1_AMPAM|nr:NADH dehydrogenase [ubiquinone] 1 alpha subcomplex assembly factor 2-like isoform X2 [Amphibalanus amphitrite]XP_043230916.1 NADH dehydrogenase [ubiquinone] 1 alpha subcomplex assembly factor 2-like isoform X2 [Amphibalanus amphitrite]XP_043230917.1 NADH dehydrogenase [ubiquinone] 1 alpha subcomplex assembly factor 2-like isoform X2 [Amphibalanus amphitrite]XP_043230918.1 NADH dehydrogenase [ubiquinone] 1 alpha subcomplex assembly factor 2-like isoform X2 [Amphibalanus amphitrite]XP_04323091
MPAERNVLAILFRNFLKSITPNRPSGNLVGSDHFGNKYYEAPADPSRGKRHPRRWIDPAGQQFDQEMPAEWEAWLRRRRAQPPTDDEVARNRAIMELKKINAAKLAEQRGEVIEPAKPERPSAFPVWEEYEVEPGQKNSKYKIK